MENRVNLQLTRFFYRCLNIMFTLPVTKHALLLELPCQQEVGVQVPISFWHASLYSSLFAHSPRVLRKFIYCSLNLTSQLTLSADFQGGAPFQKCQ